MGQFSSYVVVIRLFILLQTAMIIVSLDQDDFSVRLGQVVDDVLGAKQFETYLGQLRSDFVAQAPNGRIFTKLVAEDISREVIKRAEAVRRNRDAIVGSLGNNEKQPQPKCCPLEHPNFTVDSRFPGLTTKVLCHFGKNPETPAKATGVSDTTINTMKRNLKVIPSLKWQYFGNEYGTLYVYPGFPGCGLDAYDPRFRPWYGLTATYPVNMVIMIDKSQPMKNKFGAHTRMYYGIQATKDVIDSLNPYDNIGVIAFADDVQFPDDSCYRQGLAVATSANKEKLSDFALRIQTSLHSRANYSNAFTEAFRLLATTNDSDSVTTNGKRAKVIMLLSAGEESEPLADIMQTITAGKQLAGEVIVLAFGLRTDANSEAFLTAVSSGSFTALNNPDDQAIREEIGVYYNYFTKPSDDENVVFSVPYNDTGGLGMVTSGCLPVFALGSLQGVTCVDIPLDTLFSPIIDFRLAQLSYAFLIDSRGRVLLHPLLPKPETYKQEPIFLDMESVEISSETPVIKQEMIRGFAGNMSIERLKIFPRLGDSPSEGVGFDHQPATYFWHPISVMNASMAIVIVGDEQNNSLSWTSNFPPVLLTDELTVSDNQTDDKCNNFGRVALLRRSAVKLSLQSMQDRYHYREHGISTNIVPLKSYLQGETDEQGVLAVKAGVRESVALTYELERIWKRKKTASNTSFDVGQLNDKTLYRYVGTRDGVYRIYPAIRVPIKFDPTEQPQYRRSEVQRGRTTLYTKTDASGHATTSLTKAFTDPSKTVVLGVVGADVMFAPLFNFLLDNFDPCRETENECFAVDRSGFVVLHKDFLDNPLSSHVHITTKEPGIAADLVNVGIMRNNSCVSYADITNQLFWEVEFNHDLKLTDGHIYAITSFDLFVIVKYLRSSTATGTCTCSPPRGGSDKTQCTDDQQCQCPCYTSTDYSYCSGHFTITDTTKTCYPATLPLYLPDLTSEERHVAESLPSCLPCLSFNSQSACAKHGCCFSTNMICSACPSTSYRPMYASSTSHTRTNARVTGSPTGSSCDSVCLGLTIGLVLAVLLILAVVAVVVIWRRGHLGLPSCLQSQHASTYPEYAPNTTIIQVNNDYGDNVAYQRRESINPPSDEPVYLTLDSRKPPNV